MKNPGKVRARTYGTKSPSRSEAFKFVYSSHVLLCRTQANPSHERFPGNTKRAFKWSNLVRKARGCRGSLFSLLWAGTFFSKKKKTKNNNNPTCRDRCAQSLVRESCSRNNVVEPVGKTSLVLDTVFGHELEKELILKTIGNRKGDCA